MNTDKNWHLMSFCQQLLTFGTSVEYLLKKVTTGIIAAIICSNNVTLRVSPVTSY